MQRIIGFLAILALASVGPLSGQDMGDSTRIKINETLDRSTVLISVSNGSGANGIGSGFVATSDGWIITNHHVIADPQFRDGEILVKFKDGAIALAQVIGDDPANDLAVLRLKRSSNGKIPPLKLGDSNRISVGQTVLAKGNPLGLEGTLSQGIISAIRNLKSLTGSPIAGAIQTDASIAQGNSGGPLVNALGEVVGVISAGVFNPAGGTMMNTINFAIPVNRVKDLLSQVHMSGARPVQIARDDSGVNQPRSAQGNAQSASSDSQDRGGYSTGPSGPGSRPSGTRQRSRRSAQQSSSSMGGPNIGLGGSTSGHQQSSIGNGWVYFGIDGEDYQGKKVSGVKVLAVEASSPAARAGLRSDETPPPDKLAKRGKYDSTGHIITAVDGEKVETVDDLTNMVAEKFPGDTAVVTTVCCDESHEEKIRVKLGWSKGYGPGGGGSSSRSGLNRDINRMGTSHTSMGMGVSVRIIGPDGQPHDPTPPSAAPATSSSGAGTGGYKPSRRAAPPVTAARRPVRTGPPYLGIEGEEFAEGRLRGVKVVGIAAASPAKISGLRTDADKPPQKISATCKSTGHIIININDEKVTSMDDMEAILARRSPGDIIDLTVVSCGGLFVETIPVRLSSK
ncbi:MAG: trypsin-like peptidase domain-containing protein [Acidobacteria bacterium]|nr:trypsin-like peptidase domain-containing protein [Acidobacteriota bacterium]MBI3657453.1 trypsin-like peptidase domain-containing protein [Acidobacteriota bacterium]